MPGHPIIHAGRLFHPFRLGILAGHPGAILLLLAVGLLAWILVAWAAARIAADRGHSFGLWFLASLVLGPLGLLAALVAPYPPARQSPPAPPASPAGPPEV